MSVAVRRAGRPARFLLVGVAGYGVNLGVFAALVAAGVAYLPASVLSFRFGHEGFWPAYARYLLVGLVVVALNAAVLALLVEGAGLDETLAQALSLLAVTPPAYLMFKRWTFRLGPG